MNSVSIRLLFVLLVLTSLFSATSSAFALGDPAYSADVPVNSQSDDDRVAGLRAALGQVVARLSGDAGAATRSDVVKAMAQASSLVQQYQYVRNPDPASESHLLLSAQFDPAAVDEFMRKLHLGTHESESSNVVADQGGSVRVGISGIRSAADYSRVMAALVGSDNVLTATPERARSDGMLVVLKLRSGVQRLLENLAAAQTLSPLSDSKPVDGVDLQLVFRP